ncbi:hypothetical protein [Lysobacter gummosus]|uniref:hypothetical protein n=1 Tax=Lysobacter gummosus TaxID=262324 RepID=UPI00363D7781
MQAMALTSPPLTAIPTLAGVLSKIRMACKTTEIEAVRARACGRGTRMLVNESVSEESG